MLVTQESAYVAEQTRDANLEDEAQNARAGLS